MKNITSTLPTELLDSDNLPSLESVVFSHGAQNYVFWNGEDKPWYELSSLFPENAKRVSGMLASSGSSWEEKAFIFYQADCFDPCLYVQFGSSWGDAYESFCDNEPDLVIPPEDYGDYDMEEHSSYTSDGTPIDTDNVQGFGPLLLISMTFKKD